MESSHPSDPSGIPVLKTGQATIRNMLAAEELLDDRTERYIRRTFSIFADLAKKQPNIFKDNGYRHVKTFAPVEMVSIAVMLARYGKSRSLNLLAGDILWFRREMRNHLKDLRLNTATWKTAWELIDDLEGQRGAPDGITAAAYTGADGAESARTAEHAMTSPGSARRAGDQRSRAEHGIPQLSTESPEIPAARISTVEHSERLGSGTGSPEVSSRHWPRSQDGDAVKEASYDPDELYRVSSERERPPSTNLGRQNRSDFPAVTTITSSVTTAVTPTRRQGATPTNGGSNVSGLGTASQPIEMSTGRKRRTGLNLQATTFASRRDSNKRIKLSPED